MNLIHESINDALRETIQALGGNKVVGAKMFPEIGVELAAGKVRDCLNHDRRERFTPDQVMMIARMGRAVGCHVLMTFMLREAGYADPVPVEPEDEIARLQRSFVDSVKELHSMATRIETITATAALRRVA